MLYEENDVTGLKLVKKKSMTANNYAIASSRIPSNQSIKLQDAAISLGTITLSQEEKADNSQNIKKNSAQMSFKQYEKNRDTIKELQQSNNNTQTIQNVNTIQINNQNAQASQYNPQANQKLYAHKFTDQLNSYNKHFLQPIRGSQERAKEALFTNGEIEASILTKRKFNSADLSPGLVNNQINQVRNSSVVNTSDTRVPEMKKNLIQYKNSNSLRNEYAAKRSKIQQQSSVPYNQQARKTLASMTVNVNTLPLQRNQYISKNMDAMTQKKLTIGSRLAVNPPEVNVKCKQDNFPIKVPVRNVETANLPLKSPRISLISRNISQPEEENQCKVDTIENMGSPKQSFKVVFNDQSKPFGTIDGIKIKIRQQIKNDQKDSQINEKIPEIQYIDKQSETGLSKLKLAQKYKQQQVHMQATTERIELKELGHQVINQKSIPIQQVNSNFNHIQPIVNSQAQVQSKFQEKISIRAYKRSFANILGRQNIQKLQNQGQQNYIKEVDEKNNQANICFNNSFLGKASPKHEQRRLTHGSKFLDNTNRKNDPNKLISEKLENPRQSAKNEPISQLDFSTFNLITIQKDRAKKQNIQEESSQQVKIMDRSDNLTIEKKKVQQQVVQKYFAGDSNFKKQRQNDLEPFSDKNALDSFNQSLKTFTNEFSINKYRYLNKEQVDGLQNDLKYKITVSQQSAHRASSNNTHSQLDNLSRNLDYQTDFYKHMNISQKNFSKTKQQQKEQIGDLIQRENRRDEQLQSNDKVTYTNDFDANSSYLLTNASQGNQKHQSNHQKSKRGQKNIEHLYKESSLKSSKLDGSNKKMQNLISIMQNEQSKTGCGMNKTHYPFGSSTDSRHLSAEMTSNSHNKKVYWKEFEENIMSKEVHLGNKQKLVRGKKPESNNISISTTQTSKKKAIHSQFDDPFNQKMQSSQLDKNNHRNNTQNSTHDLSPVKITKKQINNQSQPFVKQPIYLCSQQNIFNRSSMKQFNDCIAILNQLMAFTVRSKSTIIGHNETYHKIQKLAKSCGLPQEFVKKNNVDMNSFIKTKDFLVLMRVRTHQLINQIVRQQFYFGSSIQANLNTESKKDSYSPDQRFQKISQHMHKPKILRIGADEFHGGNLRVDLGSYASKNMIMNQIGQQNSSNHQQKLVNFKFFTDQTGNNHIVVRQLLKRRTWLQLIENLKSPATFDQVSLFWTQWKKQSIIDKLTAVQLYAKIEGNGLITNKANLLCTMKYYFSERYKKQKKGPKDPFHILPLTYNIKSSRRMDENLHFQELRRRIINEGRNKKTQSIWICKPGENANRGNGIVVMPNIEHVQRFLQQTRPDEPWVVQKYINYPLLIGGRFWHDSPMRKFDIRMFALAQIVDGIHYRGYFYKEGYIRTSSFEYDIDDLSDRDIHLTNDAVQQDCREYGKYEQGNKISFKDFATYLQNYRKVDFFKDIYPQMKEAIRITLDALWMRLQLVQQNEYINKDRIKNQFELFGYDFMIDNDMNVYLIEVNTNPCLDTSPCPLLQRLITQVLDQSFKIAVDPFLQGRDIQYAQSHEMSLTELQYEMVVSNQPEIAQSFQSFNQSMIKVPSSKFLNISPNKMPELDQADKIIKAPTTPISPTNHKKVFNSKKIKIQHKKSNSKDCTNSLHSNVNMTGSKKRNNTLSRASSHEQKDQDQELSQKSHKIGVPQKILTLPDFHQAKREQFQIQIVESNNNGNNSKKMDIDQIKDIYSHQKKQYVTGAMVIGTSVRAKPTKTTNQINVKKKLGRVNKP